MRLNYTHILRVSALSLVLVGLVSVNAALVLAADDCGDSPLLCKRDSTIHLLQPLDDESSDIPASAEPLGVFFTYFNLSWPWLLGVASGIAVLQAVWGGVLIMTSAGDIDEGKTKIQWALAGMVMLALAGFILRFLNPMFYR